ncbi:MAG: hypothetical protein LBC80_06890 [Treponema sp.]|jgi:hypothetical protein|nr:hypothetical protein [Treponema sp.]
MKKIICVLLCFSFVFGAFANPVQNVEIESLFLNQNFISDLSFQFSDISEGTIQSRSVFGNQNNRINLNNRNNDITSRFSINGLHQNSQRDIVPLQYSDWDSDTLVLWAILSGVVIIAGAVAMILIAF